MEGCRPAEAADLARIAQLARLLRDEIGDLRGGPLWIAHEGRPEPLEHAYAELIEREDAVVLAGTILAHRG